MSLIVSGGRRGRPREQPNHVTSGDGGAAAASGGRQSSALGAHRATIAGTKSHGRYRYDQCESTIWNAAQQRARERCEAHHVEPARHSATSSAEPTMRMRRSDSRGERSGKSGRFLGRCQSQSENGDSRSSCLPNVAS